MNTPMSSRTSFAQEALAFEVLPEERMSGDQISAQGIHLSEDELDDHLMGDLSLIAATHLEACEHCTQRVANASEPIANFRDVAMAWSERRSATMPLPAAPAQGLMWQRRMGWAMATGILAVGIAITGADRGAGMLTANISSTQASETTGESAAAVPAKMATVSVPAATEAADHSSDVRVSADNRMLNAIDTELDASVESPAALGLEPVSDNQPRQQMKPASLQD